MLSCHIVKDLLPSYLEHLTSPETDAAVEAHLEACENCRAVRAAMEAEIPIEHAPEPRSNFLKKLRRQQIIGAVLSVLITLLCMYGLYSMEYDINLASTAETEAAISLRCTDIDVDFVESISIKDRVFVLFRNADEADQGHGVAQFERGLFGKYRLRSCEYSTWQLNTCGTLKVGAQDYLLISGINEPVGAETFRIYADYRWSSYDGEIVLDTSAVEPAYDGETGKELLILEPLTKDEAEAVYQPWSALYYDADGNELDSRELAAVYGYDGEIRGGQCGSGRAPTTMYIWLGITLLLGAVFVRYYVKP